jgi:hypothetical protein
MTQLDAVRTNTGIEACLFRQCGPERHQPECYCGLSNNLILQFKGSILLEIRGVQIEQQAYLIADCMEDNILYYETHGNLLSEADWKYCRFST